MMKKHKLLAVIMFFSSVFLTLPQINIKAVDIAPMYSNIADMQSEISLSGDMATCTGSIIALSEATNITITMSLQRQNTNGSYVTLKTWPKETVNDIYINVSKQYYVDSGYRYRTYIAATVVRGGVTESASLYSGSIYCD